MSSFKVSHSLECIIGLGRESISLVLGKIQVSKKRKQEKIKSNRSCHVSMKISVTAPKMSQHFPTPILFKQPL